tara:strand:+ start:441 stop:2243 length:1803 start_codon:yes stop_codon:yes gene_type:complete
MGNIYSYSRITYDKLNFKPLKWPKKDEDWNELIKPILLFLKEFQDLETPQETLVQLSIKLYEVCQKNLPYKKSEYNLPPYFQNREKIIQSLCSKRYFPRPTCSNQELADRFQDLNYGQNKVSFPNDFIVNPNWSKFDSSDFKYKDFKEVLKTKRNLKSNYDGLCYELVRRIPLLKMKLVRLFNKVFKSSELPEEWYHGIAYGLYKGGKDTTNPLHFRPLIRMDTFSKLYWHMVVERLKTHFQKNNIMNTNIQKAFQNDTNGVIQSLFIHQMVKPISGVVVYLDIKNAFGSLQTSFVKLVLETYGVPNFLVRSIVFYLENRIVWVKNEKRKWNTGIPQGCVLSNLLFILCMNYILTNIHDKYYTKFGVSVFNCKFLIQAFADDIVIYGQSVKCLQIILDELFNLLSCSCLKLQVNKCIVDYNNQEPINKLKLNGFEIPNINTKPNFKYLGQYAILSNIWEHFGNDLKEGLQKIKEEYTKILTNPTAKDYWYAYQLIWKYQIAWFMNVFDTTNSKYNLITDIEKEWFSSIPGLENRITDADYNTRQIKAQILRHKTLNYSLDSRINMLYRESIGERYQEISKLYLENPTLSVVNSFRKNFYN